MRKEVKILVVGCALVAAAIAGRIVGTHSSEKELPVFESMALYPDLTMQELTNRAPNILHAKVEKVENTYMYEVAVSLTDNFEEASDTVSYPVTPVTLKVIDVLKGEPEKEYFTYIEMGGITPDFIQQPNGYAMEEGMEVILFLNEEGFGWGEQSIFPVIDGQVILTNRALKDVGGELVSDIETESINTNIRSQLHSESVKVMELKSFYEMIDDMLKGE